MESEVVPTDDRPSPEPPAPLSSRSLVGLLADPSRRAVFAALVLGGGQVLWVGPDGQLPALDAALVGEERDLAGARVIPGLVDGHAHTTGGGASMRVATL